MAVFPDLTMNDAGMKISTTLLSAMKNQPLTSGATIPKFMTSITEYNSTRTFTYEMAEGRLKKCARLISGLPPGKLLDIGCSNGDWALHWKAGGWEPHGIDIDKSI